MPSRRLHKRIEKTFLGREFDMVNRVKDSMWPILGKRHRRFFHDPLTNVVLGLVFGPKAAVAGFLHDFTDKAFRRKRTKK
jgi:hypothetical protein